MDVMEVWQTPKRSWPVQLLGVLIRWRVELVLLAAWVTGMVWLNIHTSSLASWLIFAGVLLVLVVVPPTRWFLVTRMWCVIDRHRLRTCLRNARARTMNLDGALPFMLWARPTKTGERVWLWARAGSSAGDLEDVLEYIAPACYARDARVHRVRKLSTLMAVDVIRRDPLDKSTPIDSPLAKLTSLVGGRNPLEGTEPISGATITPLPVPAESSPTVKTRKASAKTAESVRPSVLVNGEDLSDYID
jgi:hypothetical protein